MGTEKFGTAPIWSVALHMIYGRVVLLFLRLHASVCTFTYLPVRYCSSLGGAEICFGKYGVRCGLLFIQLASSRTWFEIGTEQAMLSHTARPISCVGLLRSPIKTVIIRGAYDSKAVFDFRPDLSLGQSGRLLLLPNGQKAPFENDVHLPVLFLLLLLDSCSTV